LSRLDSPKRLGQTPGHSYGGYKESGISREFSLEGMLESQNILAMTTSTKQAEIDSAQNAVDTLNAQLDTAQFRHDYGCAIEQPSDEPIIRQEPTPKPSPQRADATLHECPKRGGAALFEVACHVDLRKQLASASLGSEFRIRRVSDPTGPMRLLITSTSSSSLRTWRNPRCNKRSILRRLVESLFNIRQ
jgi:hypothetical protein